MICLDHQEQTKKKLLILLLKKKLYSPLPYFFFHIPIPLTTCFLAPLFAIGFCLISILDDFAFSKSSFTTMQLSFF